MTQAKCWKEAETYTLFPVEVRPSNVLMYAIHKNGAGLPRESNDIIVPGDYGVYTTGKNIFLCATTESVTLTHRKAFTLPFIRSSSHIFGYGGSNERTWPADVRQGIPSSRRMYFTLSDV